MKKLFALALVSMLLVCSGCTNWERNTYQTLAASQAVINQAQVDYEAGSVIPHNQASFTIINTAKAVQTTTVNQMVAYEQLKATGGTSSALAVAETQVDAALVQLPEIISEVKTLYLPAKAAN